MAVNLSPIGNDAPFVDASGNPLNGGLLYTYTAGSSTPENTYTTNLGNVANANPIELNSNGYPASGASVVSIWLTAGVSYLFVLKTAAGVTVWSRDNIEGINDTTVTVDQWLSGPAPTYVSGTSFTVAGDQTSTLTPGLRVKITDAGGTKYGTIISSVFGALTTVVLQMDAATTLSSPLSALSYGVMSANNTSEPDISKDYVCQGRLTLTSGTAVTTTDVTAAETVYFTPFRGDQIDLYESSIGRWVRFRFSEISMDVPDAAQMNDVFIYNNAGTLTADVVAWTNDTTRATALATQNGVLVKSGAVGRRYVGSFYGTTAGNGQTEDSLAKRYVWNYYNRVVRPMRAALETADTWTYTLDAYRIANANAANQLDLVIGVSENPVFAQVFGSASNDGAALSANFAVGVGVDSSTVNSATLQPQSNHIVTNGTIAVMAVYRDFPGIGRHDLRWLERSTAAGTTTWKGDNGSPTTVQCGIMGELFG